MWTHIAWVGFGGALGALARFAVGRALHGTILGSGASGIPLGTLLVNVIGCLAFGFLVGWSSRPAAALAASTPVPFAMPEDVRLGVFVGFLGSFTTFSTFGADTVQLGQSGASGGAIANVVAHNGLGLLAVWGGLRLATVLARG